MRRSLLLACALLAPVAATAQETATPTRPQYVALSPVYFGYDSIEITDATRTALLEAAKVLAANPDAEITVVGHTDERGTEAYNYRLGHRRAGAVAAFLAAQGVAPARIHTTSAGETSPARAGSGEAAWSQNRRVEFQVKGNTPLRIPPR